MFGRTQSRNEIVRVHALARPKRCRSVPQPVREPPRQGRARAHTRPGARRRRAHPRHVLVPPIPPRRPVQPTARTPQPAPRAGRPIAEPRHHPVLVVFLPAHVRHLGRLLPTACKHRARVARAFARPEPGRVVVGRAHEDVAERVEGERPDVGVVRLGEGGAREQSGLEGCGFGAGEVPVEDGAFGTARDEDRVDGMPGDGCKGCVSVSRRGEGWERTADFFFVPFEDAELFHGADVKDAHGLIA